MITGFARKEIVSYMCFILLLAPAWTMEATAGEPSPRPAADLRLHTGRPPAPDTVWRVGAPAGELTITDPTGRSSRLHQHRGNVLLLNFWASWCPPCREEIPGLNRVSADYAAKRVTVLGIAVDPDDQRNLASASAALDIRYPVGKADLAVLQSALDLRRIPISVILDRELRVRWLARGHTETTRFRLELDRVLREDPVQADAPSPAAAPAPDDTPKRGRP